jgi:NADH-quinone oxidoreductase subunit C
MTFEEIKSIISEKFPEAILGEDLKATPHALMIDKKSIHMVCELLHTHEQLYFDMLSCLSGLDNGPESGTMEVIYNLYSIPFNLQLMLKVELDRNQPEIDSVTSIWRTANWHEREAFDMLGIKFINHPDLRRILMPLDWEGFPIQKDYQEQEKYHGMNVIYDRREEVENWKEDKS